MTKSEIIHGIEALIPVNLLSLYRRKKYDILWSLQQFAYRRAERKLQKIDRPLNVIYLTMFSSVWKYDSVYQLMQRDTRFNPIILVCPVIDSGEDFMIKNLHDTIKQFEDRGYKVINAFDEKTGACMDIQKLQPDIVMYSSLWTGHTDKKYDHIALRKYLKCYVNYGFCSIGAEWGIASAFHGLMWRCFSECELNRQLAISLRPKEMQNMVVTGYPIYDEIQTLEAKGADWKIQDKKHKRIIWAPHHTIAGNDGLLKLSTFLLYADTIKELAQKYADQVQFVFKPHPQLKTALYNHPDWGQKKTDTYYDWWKQQNNSNVVDGSYTDLFKSSDAMIHDCGSFIVEYLYVQKPVMFLGINRDEQSNSVGKKAYAAHYHGMNAEDIERFISDVVIEGKDTMQVVRNEFYQNILVPPNGKTVAENIVDELSKALQI